MALPSHAEDRGWQAPLLAELEFADAHRRRSDTRLVGVVPAVRDATASATPDGDGPAWALVTSHITLERDAPLLVRALSAVLLAQPHRRPVLDPSVRNSNLSWIAEQPLRAASILVIADFVAGAAPLAA